MHAVIHRYWGDSLVRGHSGWHLMVDRLARIAWIVLLISVAIAIVGGAVVAAWNPETSPPPAEATECEDPPCFGGGGMPGPENLPIVIPFLGYSLAILLGVPNAVAGAWGLVRGRWRQGFQGLLIFVGPVVFLIGMEIVPHVINPCLVADVAGDQLPRFCGRTESGADIADRGHALHHALVGAVPMAMLYRWALRRWRPDVLNEA